MVVRECQKTQDSKDREYFSKDNLIKKQLNESTTLHETIKIEMGGGEGGGCYHGRRNYKDTSP